MTYFLNETLCQKLPLIDERQRYFLDIIRTRLNVGSPLFIQANSLNIFFIAQDIISHIKKVKNEEKKYINYLKSSLNEILIIQKEDLVYRDLKLPFEIIKDNIENCIKAQTFEHSDYNLELLEYNLNLILKTQEKYEKIAYTKLHQN